MTLGNSLKTTFRLMAANKLRSFLTMLGIIIGIASVVVVYSAGEGIYGLIVGQVESFGTDIIQTEIKVPSNKKGSAANSSSAGAIASGVQITTLTLKDMEDVSRLANVKNAYAGILAQEQVSYQNEVRRAYIMGTTASYVEVDSSKMATGQFFSDTDDRNLAQVVVLGYKMKEKLFGDVDPIGKSITLRRQKFTVVGVMAEKGAAAFMDFDDYVYVPVRTLQKKIMGINHLFYMVHQLRNVAEGAATADEAADVIRRNHDISDPEKDDFRVTTMTESLDTLNTIVQAITWLLLGIVIISLVVGGVGIMNVMYVAVSERTSEIGLRKAVGAKVNDILSQFLLESVVITVLGGVLGILFGVALSLLMAFGAQAVGLDWQFVIPIKAYVVSLVFSLLCGVVFGLYPARQAAMLDPIEAMRSE